MRQGDHEKRRLSKGPGRFVGTERQWHLMQFAASVCAAQAWLFKMRFNGHTTVSAQAARKAGKRARKYYALAMGRKVAA